MSLTGRKQELGGFQRVAQRSQKAASARLRTAEGLWLYHLLGKFVGRFKEDRH